MDILISVGAKIAELTVEPVGRQTEYLLCYRNILKELKDQVEELKTMKEHIDHQVDAERRNGREIEGDVLRWQESVTKTLEEAQQLCEDSRDANVGCSKWSFPNLKSRHQHSRKAKKMAKTIVEVKKKGNFERVGYDQPLDIINNFCAARGSDQLESRNLVKKDVVLSLKDPKISKIGVYGISGVGKTTLVKEVAKQVKDENLFDAVVMVTISQTKLERIQDEIAEQLGLHLEGMTSSGRANRLCDRIKKEKTVLIILDDLWEKIDLEKLGIPYLDTHGKVDSEKMGVPLKDNYKGCKLLMTARSEDILQRNDAQENFPLQVLNRKESLRLFEVMVGEVKDAKFQTIATQVAQRCAGLPVLIVTIAKSLKNKGFHYWKDTLNNLKRVDNKDVQETLVLALEFNLNRLEDEVKKIFLLCGVHGRFIVISDLLKYAIGLGVFKHVDTIEDARNRLYRIIDDLKASCLLDDFDARWGMITMHDSVHEGAVRIASKYVFTKCNSKLQDWPRKDILERCTHIILLGCYIQKLPERLDFPHLTFLHINSSDNKTLEIPDTFFEGVRNLEALDLTGMIMSSLPISLRYLTKLKTLCLDYCPLKDMTGIGALINLEILSLISSSMEEFPSEIEQLARLRMLDLRRSTIKTTLPNILCKLTKIEELYMGNARIKWEVESSSEQKTNLSLPKLGHLIRLTTLEIQVSEAWLLPKDIPFDKLERYKIVIGDKWGSPSNKETLRFLKVKLDTSIRGERGIKTLIERAEDLYLDKVSGFSNVLFELNGEGFPSLKHLHIQNNGEIQHIINSMKRNQTQVLFPKLETLILHNLNNLVKICHGPVRNNSFGQLKFVNVKSCDQLICLFSISVVKAFSHLVEIKVSECNSMTKIVSLENAEGEKIIDDNIEFLSLRSLTLQHLPVIYNFYSHELTSLPRTKQSSLQANTPTPFFSAKVKFSNLETLKLSSVNLKTIWDDKTPCLMENLANLTVEDCSGLKYLFPSSMIGKLSNLKQLEICQCDTMEKIVAIDEKYGVAPGEVLFPKLEAIIIKDMQNLKMIWQPILASNSLASFRTLEVKNCEKIEKIFPNYMNGALAILETLKVEGCMSVEEIFQLDVDADDTTQLKYITLLQLPQLKQIWSKGSQSSLRFKNLKVVRVEDCGDLEYLFPFSVAMNLPLLEQITIKRAKRIKEIVSEREEPLDDLVEFEFNQLTSVVLWSLQNLQGFCAGNHSLSCSLLKKLSVYNCEKLKLFKTQDTSSQGRLLHDNLHVSMKQPLSPLGEVIGKWERLCLNSEDAHMILQSEVPDQFHKLKFLLFYKSQATSPYWFLRNISSLECLVIPDKRPRDRNGECEIKARLKYLKLYKLNELQHIYREVCQLDLVLDVLEYLHVKECSSLKHLVSSSVTFNHLTYLEVENCSGLMYLVTSSTARSMVKLTTFKIGKCDSIERIVAEEEGESINEIAFNNLEFLELDSLSKLQTFCSSNCLLKLPLLKKLVIRRCSRMTSFSARETNAPLLQKILTDEQDEMWCWEGDLTRTITKMLQDKKSASTSRALSSGEAGAESKANEIDDSGKQEMHKLPIPHTEMNETIQIPLAEAGESTLTQTSVQETVVDPPSQALEAVTSSVENEALQNQEMYDISVERPLVQSTKLALSTAAVHDADGSQGLQIYQSENLLVHETKSIMNHDEENIGTEGMHESIQKILVQNAKDMLIPVSVQDIATGTHVTQESIDKPFVQATQTAWDITIIQGKEESCDSDIHLAKNLFNQTITSIAADYTKVVGTQEENESKSRFSIHDAQNVFSPTVLYDSAVGTQEVCESTGRFTVHDAQNVASHAMVYDSGKSDGSETVLGNNLSCQATNSATTAENRAAIERAPSRAPKAPSSSTPPDVCNSFKELDISVQLLPYLEAGVKKHPRVLNWLTTERRRVFASSSFSLFAEVTRILRTTRRMNLTEDDRNYIRECCAVLQGVGFDDGWISYVHRRIEEGGDEEDLEMKVEEVEAQLESINKELVLLRDKSSRLHGYICLSTLMNALFIILFFIIIYVYQKKN